MCRVLEVSKAGYYAWRDREQSARARYDAKLTVRIRKISERSNRTYGSRRIHAELKAEGISCGHNRVARLMREDGLQAVIKRRFRVTTNSAHGRPVADNILARKFNIHDVAEINRAWVGDITYIATHEGFLYLAVVLDLRSRRIVGWAMRHTLDAELAIAAMISAVADRRPPSGLIFHCDQGKQYVAEPFQTVLRRHGIVLSMSRKANCWDNAVAESFFGSIKRELLARGVWKTREAARSAIFNYIEAWYNTRRRHSTLGYESPASFEARESTRAA
jgi:transposase InsO family protein